MLDTMVSSGKDCVLCTGKITFIALDEGNENLSAPLWGAGFNAMPLQKGQCCYDCLLDKVYPARGIPTTSMRDRLRAGQVVREEYYDRARNNP